MGTNSNHTIQPPAVHINKSLDKFAGKVLFPEKVAKAKQMLKGVQLPKKKKKS